jgi:DmsE family decaheme c-type cytochrome
MKVCRSVFKRYSKALAVFVAAAFLSAFYTTVTEASAPVDWTELQPAVEGSGRVADIKDCLECHEDYMAAYDRTRHARAFTVSAGVVPDSGNACEVCHGPMLKHFKSPRKKDLFVSLKPAGPLTPYQRNSVCLQCHEKGMRMSWQGSQHEMTGVGCSDCHYVSERRSKKNLFINEDPKKACTRCHTQRRAQLMRSSHMPLREGKMDCASCHNPHGGPGPSLLKTVSINETCYLCHAEKRGPFLWEHAPVRENCSNCHEPHGSNHDNLLKRRMPYLCQSCHSTVFHPSELYTAAGLPGGSPAQQLLGKGCLNCHSLVHGSNHPSGTRLQR